MNTATWIVILVIIAIAVLAFRYISTHGLDSCGGNCTHCSGQCKWVGDVKKAQRAIARKKRIQKFFHLGRSN